MLQERLKREPTPEELAEVLGITARHVRRLITAAVTPTSLDAPIGEGETALAELIPDENALDPAEFAERNANAKVIQKLMADLPPRERVILEYRFGFDGGKGTTLEEAGQRFGITRERIRQIQAKLLKQLRRSIEKLEDHERNEILKGLKASTAA
jgi:RNA polymerase primary sigma factor